MVVILVQVEIQQVSDYAPEGIAIVAAFAAACTAMTNCAAATAIIVTAIVVYSCCIGETCRALTCDSWQ
jgi:hypothetical protein